jgi:hypothetical protein
VQHFEELQNAYKQLETKYSQLLNREEQSKKEQISLVDSLHENEELKQKIDFLENELLAMKSTQSHHQDSQINIERLKTEIQLSVSSFSKKEKGNSFFLKYIETN